MTVQLPKTCQALIHKLSEEEIMTIALMHRIKSWYPETNWFSLYRYDFVVILASESSDLTPNSLFRNMKDVFRTANTSDITVDIRFKHWSSEEITYEIQEFRNVIIWACILDRTRLSCEEKPKDVPLERYTNCADNNRTNLIRAIKRGYKNYR